MSDRSFPPFANFPPPPADPAQAALQAAMQVALGGPYPRFYVNAVGIAITPSDLVLTLICNGSPVGIINMALPVAKATGEDLVSAVKEYERTGDQTVQTSGQIAATMQRAQTSGTKE